MKPNLPHFFLCCKVVDEATFVRPMYAGNAVVTVKTSDPLKVRSPSISLLVDRNFTQLSTQGFVSVVEERQVSVQRHIIWETPCRSTAQ